MKFPEIDHVEYTLAVFTYDRLTRETREANALLERLRGTVHAGAFPDGSPRYADGDLTEAIQADDADRARAAMEGRKDPGRKREDKVRAAITDAADQARILGQAGQQAETAVFDVLTTDATEVQAAITTAVEQTEVEYRQALTRVQEAREAYWNAKRLRFWATLPSRQFTVAQPPGFATLRHLSQNGEPVPAELIWTALEAEVTVPVQPRKVLRYDTHTERVMGGGRVLEEFSLSVPVFADDVPPAHQPGVLSIDGALVLMPDTGDDD